MNISEYLARKNIPFQHIDHPPTYSAQHMAQMLHLPGRQVAKTVLLRVCPETTNYIVAVLPATQDIDLDKLATVLHKPKIELANNVELGWRFPDCELGVVPPFGSEYGMQTVVDTSITENATIAFEGTKHIESIQMSYDDFEALEHPQVASIAKGSECPSSRKRSGSAKQRT